MDSPTHIIDPDGEVIIVLLNADCSFAEMSERMIAYGHFSEVDEEEMECLEDQEPIPLTVEEPDVAEERIIRTEEPVSDEGPSELPLEQPVESGVVVPESQDRACFRIQVSAKHLMLASSVFSKLLTGGWKESLVDNKYSEKSPVEITAQDWDIEALLILLRAIHGQQYQVPRKLTLEMLAKVAVLVDYYKCKEAVYIWTSTWIDALKDERPKTYSRAAYLWLWISWFFQLPARFMETTATIMSCSNGRISNLGLPIPSDVIGAMNERREEVIDNLIHRLHQLQKDLLDGSRGCSYECRAIMYGALTQQMQSNNLLSPRPDVPFRGVIYKQLAQRVSNFQSPQWAVPGSYYSSYDYPRRHSCSDSSFASVFKGLKDSIESLHLQSFIS